MKLTNTPQKLLLEITNYMFQLNKDKNYDVEIKEHKERRSNDANAYCWVLLQKMAEKLKTDKDSLYIDMLSKYGVFTHLIVKPSVVDKIKQEWRIVKDLGEVTVKGTKGIQLQCYFGSSTYNSKEMSTFLEGIVNECRDLEIETMTPQEIQSLKNSWGK